MGRNKKETEKQEAGEKINEGSLSELTDEQKQLVNERQKMAKDPNAKFLTWDEVVEKIKREYKARKD